MLNFKLLENHVQRYINDHLQDNLAEMALKGTSFEGVQTSELIAQIEAKLKCKKKLPTWYSGKQIIYANKLNIEQSSSEITANYKKNLIGGETLLDLTGGFGVDTYYFSKTLKHVTYCEVNKNLSEIVKHNLKILKASNIIIKAMDGLLYIQQKNRQYDWIYIDPSRRNKIGNKLYFIEECCPNVLENLDLLLSKSNNILIKLSPMLDIKSALKVLKYTKEVHVVAIKNEVKELLFLLQKGYTNEACIKAINLQTTQPNFEFKISQERTTIAYQKPMNYLYEPNAAILKCGAFKNIAIRFKIMKLGQHTHLYSASKIIKYFPGNIYKIHKIIPYKKQLIRKEITGRKVNIKTRNFPNKTKEVKKEYKLKDGGNQFVFFTTWEKRKCVMICSKI